MPTTEIGFVAALLTTIAFIPQAITTIRTKHTRDISLPTYILFTTGIFLWFVYGLLIGNSPIILANAITLIFTSIILIMKIKYG